MVVVNYSRGIFKAATAIYFFSINLTSGGFYQHRGYLHRNHKLFLGPKSYIDVTVERSDSERSKREQRLVVGLNKYSHDSSICAADAETGEVLFYLSKERLSRRKHDGGPTGTLVEEMLHTLDLEVDCIERVVVNNHHHRVLPMEESLEQLEWQVALGINHDEDTLDELNLLSDVDNKLELSHHLAHAYSAAAQAPFDRGLVVVMDGMGETYGAMANAKYNSDDQYICDLAFDEEYINIPHDIRDRRAHSRHGWREGESVYTFVREASGNGLLVKPFFKRWIEEKTPPALYNHGFENMESIGAVYSKASSHIFGDWNACGKVMGLAPWYSKWVPDGERLVNTMSGKVFVDDGDEKFRINSAAFQGEPLIGSSFEFNEDTEPCEMAKRAISCAESVQRDLDKSTSEFISWLKKETDERNLCLVGGVGLNSVMNGKITRNLGFDNVFIPPYPGDDGIAVGCCAYGLFGNLAQPNSISTGAPVWSGPLSAYLGPIYNNDDIENAIEEAKHWIEVSDIFKEDVRIDTIANTIASGAVVAWYHGRSEAGPRALGHRSILADPRKGDLVKFINNAVKGRESFRPFAPSVLAENANEWFEDVANNASPYMSITTQVRPDKIKEIPAVVHIDGSSRLQTVRAEDEPLYHKLISKFYEITGVPMLLNTSFNTLKGEPIVETPTEAIRSFLNSLNSIEVLSMGNFFIGRKDPDPADLFEVVRSDGITVERKIPVRAGPFLFEQNGSIIDEKISSEEAILSRTTKVRMPDRILHDDSKDGGWVELDELDVELLGMCNGENGAQEMIEALIDEDGNTADDDDTVQAVINSLVKLFDFTFIYW